MNNNYFEALRPGFLKTAKMGAASALMAAGVGMSSPAASAQQLEMELLDMVGMGGLEVSGFVSMTNDVFWRGLPLVPGQGFGINGAVHMAVGQGGYLGLFGTNYDLGDTNGVLVAYGGYAGSVPGVPENIGSLGYDLGMSYLFHTGTDDSVGKRTEDSKRRSFYEIHIAGSYTDPVIGSSISLRMDFDYYHNGSIHVGSEVADADKAYWAIHMVSNWSYTPPMIPALTVGWFVGGYVEPLLDPDNVDFADDDASSDLDHVYGGFNASYAIGKGMSLGLRAYWNDVPGTDGVTTPDSGHWVFSLTKAF